MRRLLVAVAMAVPSVAIANSDDLVTRPLVLERGGLIARLAVEIELRPQQFARPLSIAPDVWVGVTPRLTLGLVHSNHSIDQVDPRSSLCFRGDAMSCDRVYRGSGIDARWRWREGPLAVAPRARLYLRDVDPWKPALTIGALVRWTRGRYAIWGDPYLRLGLANRDLGNRAKLVLPVWLGIQPTCRWLIALRTGWDSELATLRDGWHVPIALDVVARATSRIDIAIAGGFTQLLGPQVDLKQRSMSVAVAYHH